MTKNKAVKKAKQLVKKYKTRNPFEIAIQSGIEVIYADLGSLKGMYTNIKRNRFIVISNEVNEQLAKLICAHELGHDQLHREQSKITWHKDLHIYNINSQQEYEANYFAAELLIDENDLIDNIKTGMTIDEISIKSSIDKNLIGIKVKMLIDDGYEFIDQDFCSNFIK